MQLQVTSIMYFTNISKSIQPKGASFQNYPLFVRLSYCSYPNWHCSTIIVKGQQQYLITWILIVIASGQPSNYLAERVQLILLIVKCYLTIEMECTSAEEFMVQLHEFIKEIVKFWIVEYAMKKQVYHLYLTIFVLIYNSSTN